MRELDQPTNFIHGQIEGMLIFSINALFYSVEYYFVMYFIFIRLCFMALLKHELYLFRFISFIILLLQRERERESCFSIS